MNLKEIKLKKTYTSNSDDILNDFYIPALKSSINYYRLSGYFSSRSLSIAAAGIGPFIRNGGNMKLIFSYKIQEEDFEILKKESHQLDVFIGNKFLENFCDFEDEFAKSHLLALAWMLRKGRLNIKIALTNCGIFHQKVGIFEDKEGNKISFSGSVNETLKGWIGNVEEFKVFNSWESENNEYLKEDLRKFEIFWDNRADDMLVYDLPEALRKKIIDISPNNFDESDISKLVDTTGKINSYESIKPREYQIEAIDQWKINGFRGIFEMATGTGKTYTSLFAIKKYLVEQVGSHLVVVCCPYQHLVDQWENSIDMVFPNSIQLKCYDSKNKWYEKLNRILIDSLTHRIKLGFIITTTDTGSSDLFIEAVNSSKIEKIVICDEVHNIGAERNKNFLKIKNCACIGLSATPIRKYDEEGNRAIIEYFLKTVYVLGIKEAIAMDFLVPYFYQIKFCELEHEEIKAYKEISKKISLVYSKSNFSEEQLSILLIKRARIISQAHNKFSILRNILSEIEDKTNLLVFSAENPSFFSGTLEVLEEFRVKTLKITSDIPKEERLRIIKKLERKDIDCIISMRCVDEGVDIPTANKAIILSSSSNYKQYVQRRGRVLRKDPSGLKDYAFIYDICVIPPDFDSDLEKKLFERELRRIVEFSSVAKNKNQVMNDLLTFSQNNCILQSFLNVFSEAEK